MKRKLIGILIFMIPLGVSLIFILILKHTIGNVFPYNMMVPKTIFMLMIGAIFYTISKKENYTLSLSILAASMLSASIWMMFGSETILGGRGGDNGFEMVMVSRFMNGIGFQDVVYSNLHNFYPFYFQLFIGKLAVLFDWNYYKSLKYGAFMTIYTMPIASYFLWKNLYSNRVSFLMTLGTIWMITMSMYFRKSFEVIPLMLIIPWWIYYFSIAEKNIKNAILGGLLGGLMFSTYYYWFFPILIASIYVIVVEFSMIKRNLKYYSLFTLFILLASSLYLFPYLYDLFSYGSHALQNRYFRASHLNMPLENIKSMQEYLFLFGLIYIIMFSRKKVERYLLILVSSAYIWVFLGHIGIVLDTPLLTVKMKVFIKLLLSLSVMLMLNEFIINIKYIGAKAKSALSIGLIILIVAPLFTYMSNSYKSKDLKAAKNINKVLTKLDTNLAQMIDGKTILAARKRMTMSLDSPSHFFTAWSSFFSHPSALLSERLMFLKCLSQSENSKFIHWMLRNNKFVPIDFVWFKDNKYDIDMDTFPKERPAKILYINFHKRFFDDLEQVTEYHDLYYVPKITKDIQYKDLGTLDKEIFLTYAK